jgi:AcrR family transcriptional regulator
VGVPRTSADGQPLGERGIRTRQRILEAIGAAIERNGLRGIRLADIAQEVGFKPPAFYQYFSDLDEAILALCAEAGDLAPHFEVGDEDWGGDHPQGTRPFVEQFFRYWDENRPLLTARHVSIMSGDRRFQDVANESFRPVAEALQSKIEAGQRDGRIDPNLHPVALGAVLNLMLDVAGMAAPGLQRYWDDGEGTELVAAVSYVFDRVLGVGPDDGDLGHPDG